MNIDPRRGAAFLATIDSGSLEEAAVALHITPSAVSQRISALEDDLGMPLLVRTRPCRPTAPGMRLLQFLRRRALLEAEFATDLDAGAGADTDCRKCAGRPRAGQQRPHFLPAGTGPRRGLHQQRRPADARLQRQRAGPDALPDGGFTRHAWTIQPVRLERMGAQLVAAARKVLLPLG